LTSIIKETSIFDVGLVCDGIQKEVEHLYLNRPGKSRVGDRSVDTINDLRLLIKPFLWVVISWTTSRKVSAVARGPSCPSGTISITPREYGRFVRNTLNLYKRLGAITPWRDLRQDILKYEFGCLMCRVFRDPKIPLKPLGYTQRVFSGLFAKFIYKMAASRNFSIAASLLLGCKKLWPELGAIRRAESLIDHMQNMSRVNPTLPDWFSDVSKEICLENGLFQLSSRFLPTNSACYEASRSVGGNTALFPSPDPIGAQGSTSNIRVREVLRELLSKRASSPLEIPLGEKYVEMALSGASFNDLKGEKILLLSMRLFTLLKKVDPSFSDSTTLSDLVSLVGIDRVDELNIEFGLFDSIHFRNSVKDARERVRHVKNAFLRSYKKLPEFSLIDELFHRVNSWRDLAWTLAATQAERSKTNYVTPQVIPEPSKFRIITKGQGYLYTAIQPVQGSLLDVWKHQAESTMDIIDLRAAIELRFKNVPSDWEFHSVDYKSATDLLFMEVTLVSLTDQLEFLQYNAPDIPIHKALALKAIEPAVIRYKDSFVIAVSIFDIDFIRLHSWMISAANKLYTSTLSFGETSQAAVPLLPRELNKVNWWSLSHDEIMSFWYIRPLKRDKDVLFLDFSTIAKDVVKHTLKKGVLPHLSGHGFEENIQSMGLLSNASYFDVLQTNGQLMGGPLSFPLLCHANKATHRHFVRTYCPEAEAFKPFVNGDDMLFACPPGLRNSFSSIARSIGFVESLGKNYVSKDLMMINNRVFRRDKVGTVHEVGFLNAKIVGGFSLKTGESQAIPPAVGKEFNRTIRLAPWTRGILPEMMRRFREIYFPKDFVANWFMPSHLGGYGVEPFGLIKYSPRQLQVATYFVQTLKDPFISNIGVFPMLEAQKVIEKRERIFYPSSEEKHFENIGLIPFKPLQFEERSEDGPLSAYLNSFYFGLSRPEKVPKLRKLDWTAINNIKIIPDVVARNDRCHVLSWLRIKVPPLSPPSYRPKILKDFYSRLISPMSDKLDWGLSSGLPVPNPFNILDFDSEKIRVYLALGLGLGYDSFTSDLGYSGASIIPVIPTSSQNTVAHTISRIGNLQMLVDGLRNSQGVINRRADRHVVQNGAAMREQLNTSVPITKRFLLQHYIQEYFSSGVRVERLHGLHGL